MDEPTIAGLSREQVANWRANVDRPGPVLAVNPGASKRLADSWFALADAVEQERSRAEAAESRATELEEALRRAVVILDNLGYKASLPEARSLLSLPVPPKEPK